MKYKPSSWIVPAKPILAEWLSTHYVDEARRSGSDTRTAYETLCIKHGMRRPEYLIMEVPDRLTGRLQRTKSRDELALDCANIHLETGKPLPQKARDVLWVVTLDYDPQGLIGTENRENVVRAPSVLGALSQGLSRFYGEGISAIFGSYRKRMLDPDDDSVIVRRYKRDRVPDLQEELFPF